MENQCKDIVDEILSQLNEQEMYEPLHVDNSGSASSTSTAQTSRFRAPTTDEQVLEAQKSSVPKTTSRSTAWALNLWKEWTKSRENSGADYPDRPLHLLQLAGLDYWMSKFILEVRCRDGKEYPPNTLYQICCGIMRHARHYCPELNFFTQSEFSGLKKTLDGEMKRLKSCGAGAIIKRAEPIHQHEEDILWQKGILGNTTPQVLLDTMVFMCGMYFALVVWWTKTSKKPTME